MKRHYCTYLDRNYLAKGLALIESLRCHEPDFSLYVICLDEISRVILKNLDIPGVFTRTTPRVRWRRRKPVVNKTAAKPG